jgi:KUP system potassium uptake protein
MFIKDSTVVKPHRVDGTAVFMASFPQVVPAALLHHYKHNKVLHKQIVLLTVSMAPTPHVDDAERMTVSDAGEGFYTVLVRCGFMDQPDIPELLQECVKHGINYEPMTTSYYLGRTTLLPTGSGRMFRWRKRLFSALFHNERTATAYFNLPPNRVVEMGRQVEL